MLYNSYFPTTPYVLDNWNDGSPTWICGRIREGTEHIKKYGKVASISLLDSTRTDPDRLVRFAKAAAEAGADRVRVLDTVGVATPEAMYEIVRRVVDAVSPYGTIVGVHTHNDFGLALANTLAGIRAGAKMIDASVNGLGDRAGNVSITELAVAIEALYGVPSGLHIEQTMELAKYGEMIAGIKLPPNKPLVGESVFSDQSELHFLAQAQRKFAFQRILPESVGAHRSFLYGKLTSDKIIALTAQRAGIDIPSERYPAIRDALYQAAESRKGWAIHESDFWPIVLPILRS